LLFHFQSFSDSSTVRTRIDVSLNIDHSYHRHVQFNDRKSQEVKVALILNN